MLNFKKKISIVILCYKAEEKISEFINCIIKKGDERHLKYEIILVANYWEGEIDNSPSLIKKFASDKKCCKVISFPKKGAMGWDMRSGLDIANGDVLIVIDGDSQFDPNLVFWVYDKLESDNLDLCKTYRVDREDGFYRKFISNIFNFIFRILFPSKDFKKDYRDVNSKPKAFTRSAYKKMNLVSNDWFIDAEIMIQANYLKLRIGSFPICFYKSSRESFVKPIAIIEFIKNLAIHKILKKN